MSIDARRVLVTGHQMQRELRHHRGRLEVAGLQVVAPTPSGQHFSEAEMIRLLEGAVGAILGDDPLTERVLAAARDLRAVVKWGIGTDAIDFSAATRHGVRVVNTAGVFGDEVADSAMAYVLLLARGHLEIDAEVRAGRWPKREGLTLAGQTLGIVGLGSIGASVAARARAFGMDVIGHDPYLPTPPASVQTVELLNLLTLSRFVVLTCPLTRQTHHLIDGAALATMRSDSYLVNVARGPVVDEVALAVSLDQGGIAGAGLDVFETEPLPEDSPLRTLPNVILGAHNGSNTRQGVERASSLAVDRLLALLESP